MKFPLIPFDEICGQKIIPQEENMSGPRFTKTSSHSNLLGLAHVGVPQLKELFAKDPNRALSMSVRTDRIVLDYSRQNVTSEVLGCLKMLTEEMNVQENIQRMYSGEIMNNTEKRAVLHTALRNLSDRKVIVDGNDVMPEVKAVLSKVKLFSEEVLSGKRTGVTSEKFEHIVAIGIGGSYLGPEYLAKACEPYSVPGIKLHFVANVDGTDFSTVSKDLPADKTLFIIVSKTFTTAETMKNAETAKEWALKKLHSRDNSNEDIIKKHFVAVSTALDKVGSFGIDVDNAFAFWDWVGGRFSATSAVGALPLSLYLGYDNFHKVLEGAHWMDEHFRTEPFIKNIPLILGSLDVWNINFLGRGSRAVLPYAQSYSRFPAHIQQLSMESLGKRVDKDGMPIDYSTGAVIFGEPGTNGQHSFYQLIHQGTAVIPCDFVGFIKPQYEVAGKNGISHHKELMTNFFAQPDALAFGKEDADQHRFFPGDRPSNVILLNEQSPFEAGLLLSLEEHRVAAQSFIWGINAFDQFGVELGKKLGVDMRNRMSLNVSDRTNPHVYEGLNSSTKDLFRMFLNGTIGQ